jgi:hypothetical protein
MSTPNDFVSLMNDESFKRQQQETREREQRESHERRVRRGSHGPGNVKPSAADLRDSITRDRRRDVDTGKPLHFESEVRAQSRRPGHANSNSPEQAHARHR